MRILGLNGILTHGAQSTDRLLGLLGERGYQTLDVNYPFTFALMAHFRQRANTTYLLEAYRPGDCLIAHSYGCLLAYRAMQMGAVFDKVFLFAPAMKADVEFPAGAYKHIYVMHHPRDFAVWLGSLLPFHAFGRMGRDGYQGPPRDDITNLESKGGSDYDRKLHSHYFSPARIAKWADFIDRTLMEP